MIIWVLAAAWAQDPDPEALSEVLPFGLPPLYEEALRSEQEGDLDQAAFLYRRLLEEQPNIHRFALALGRVREKQGRVEQAIAVYEQLPYDADAVEALGRLLLANGRAEEAAPLFVRLRELRPEWPGTRVLEADARAQIEPDRAAALLTEYVELDAADPLADGLAPVVARVVPSLKDQGSYDPKDLLKDVLGKFPDLVELEPLLAELEVDEQARALAEAGDVPLDAEQVGRLHAAREAFAARDFDQAAALLEALVREQPSSAVTWATLADVREARGDLAGAEQAIAAAERLDPLSAVYPAKLAQILADQYGGRYDREAADAYARAVLRRADEPALWREKARVERRANLMTRSNASFERVIALDPDGPYAEEARQQLAAFHRERPPPVRLPAAAGRPADVPESAWWAYHRARAWTERAEADAPDKALAELLVAREQAPRFVPAIDLLAGLRADRGELEEAVALYEESLRLEPDRGRVVGILAALYERTGRSADAKQARARAAELGDPDALWRRAQEEAAALRWGRARRTLAEFFAHTTSGPAYDRALRLDDELRRNLRAARIAGATAALGVLALPVGWAVWRRTGSGLQALLRRSPHAWRDVARICSAIRHEVLKHHVSVLPVVASALEDGDAEPSRWMFERLLGPEGALDRLQVYVEELEAVGRAHGERLNLRHRDPVFGPMLRAFARLERVGAGVLAGRTGPRVARQLRALSDALNRDAYDGLGRLVGRLSVLRVDGALIREVYEAVREEPGFRGEPFPALRLEEPPEALHVRMFRSDLADVLANLVRNAAQATLESGGDEIGVALEVEDDPITALDAVLIRIRDHAPGRLTTAALRARLVERGLGLAVDLTGRAGGSIAVAEEPGWAKAVVVRLPRAEVVEEEPS